MVMTRKELLQIKRAELLNELFDVVDQLNSSIFETVEQASGLAERQVFLQRELHKVNERIQRLNSEK
jgi:predicted nuclease with TOPRIM domain